jgi:signal peptidase I
MTGEGFGSPPWGPVEPVSDDRDGTWGGPGWGQPRPRWTRDADDTVVDAFTPIRRDRYDDWTTGQASPGDTRPGERSPGDTRPGERRPGADRARTPGAHRATRAKRGKPDDPDDEEERPARRRRNVWIELPILVVIALTLALVVKTYAVQAFFIPSGSMQNTLAIGDRVLINKIVYRVRGIGRGDIVVFNGQGSWDFDATPPPSNPAVRFFDAVEGIFGAGNASDVYIKRVIGLPGDRVACCNARGQLTVNGVALSESSYLYPGDQPSQQRFSIKVPDGRLWVMGDHRYVSYDSRGHMGDPGGGTIPESAVLGRAFVIVWPPSQWGMLNIPATFEQPQLNSSPAAAGGSPSALDAALRDGTPTVQQSWSPLPLALGFTGAVPLTWLQRRARTRLRRRQ